MGLLAASRLRGLRRTDVMRSCGFGWVRRVFRLCRVHRVFRLCRVRRMSRTRTGLGDVFRIPRTMVVVFPATEVLIAGRDVPVMLRVAVRHTVARVTIRNGQERARRR